MIGRIVFWIVVAWIVLWGLHHIPEVQNVLNQFISSTR